MKILVCTGIYPPDIGGPATYSKILNDELPSRGFSVDILSFGEVRHYPKFLRHLVYFFRVLSRGADANVIYAQDPVSVGFPSAIAARLMNKRFLLKIVGDYAWEQGAQRFGVEDNLDVFQEKKYGLAVEALRFIEKYAAEKADVIITPSAYLKGIVEKQGVRPEKIKVIYNAFEGVGHGLKKSEARAKLDLEGFILLSVGRLVPWKGFSALIESISELKQKIEEIKLLIIGSGPERDLLEAEIKKQGLENSVFLLGKKTREEVLMYLAACDAFVLNTSYEGLSHQILEAMALGAPIITTPAGGNPELIKDKETGIFVEYNDKNGIIAAVLALRKDPKMSEGLARKAAEKSAGFSKEKMISELVKIL